MRIEEMMIKGVYLLRGITFKDTRGISFQPYSEESLKEVGIKIEVKDILYSVSFKNVIRGMHFQLPPFTQSKLVTVISGEIMDVLLDLRVNSESYGKFTSVKLTDNEGLMIYIPKGIAHGFLSLADKSIVLYIMDSPYVPEYDSGIKYDSFGYEWNVSKPVLSDRDLALQRFNEFKSPFKM